MQWQTGNAPCLNSRQQPASHPRLREHAHHTRIRTHAHAPDLSRTTRNAISTPWMASHSVPAGACLAISRTNSCQRPVAPAPAALVSATSDSPGNPRGRSRVWLGQGGGLFASTHSRNKSFTLKDARCGQLFVTIQLFVLAGTKACKQRRDVFIRPLSDPPPPSSPCSPTLNPHTTLQPGHKRTVE